MSRKSLGKLVRLFRVLHGDLDPTWERRLNELGARQAKLVCDRLRVLFGVPRRS